MELRIVCHRSYWFRGGYGQGAKALNITFGHGARHLAGTGLSQDVVESAIRADIAKQGTLPVETYVKKFINVGGKQIEYHPYKLKNGTVNVGTYYLIK